MLDIGAAKKAADQLAALANPTRLQIVTALMVAKNLTPGDLVNRLGVEFVNVSHHLGVLRTAGLVTTFTQGRKRVYQLAADLHHEPGIDKSPGVLGVLGFPSATVTLYSKAARPTSDPVTATLEGGPLDGKVVDLMGAEYRHQGAVYRWEQRGDAYYGVYQRAEPQV